MWVTYTAIAMAAAAGLRDSREWFLDGVVFTAGALCLVALYWFWGSGDITARWSSTFYWPNPFAAFLLLVVPMALVRALRAPTARLALSHRGRDGAVRGRAGVHVLAVAPGRGPARGHRDRDRAAPARWRPALLRAGVIAVAVVACVWMLGRAARSGTTGAVAARAASLSDAGDASAHGHYLILERRAPRSSATIPIVGTGPNTFGAIYASYQREVNYYARDAHSLYLQTASDMGIVGLFALTLLLVWAGRAWWRMLRRARDDAGVHAGRGRRPWAVRVPGPQRGRHGLVLSRQSITAFALAGVLARVAVDQQQSDSPPLEPPATHRHGRRAAGGPGRRAVLGTGTGRFLRGQSYANVGDFSAAAAAFSSAERWDPLDGALPDRRGKRARAHVTARPRAPVAAMRRAIQLDPMNAPHRLSLARVIATAPRGRVRNEFAEAERLLRRALELDR